MSGPGSVLEKPEVPAGVSGFSLAVSADDPFCWDADERRRQEMLLLSLFVAGKNAKTQSRKLREFLQQLDAPGDDWFAGLRRLDERALRNALEATKVGQYTRLTAALKHVRNFRDLLDVTREQLCEVPGISMKSASFFLMYTRRDFHAACWDVHLLKWAAKKPRVFGPRVFRNTPPPPHYLEMERRYLDYCRSIDQHPTLFDFSVWSSYRKQAKANS